MILIGYAPGDKLPYSNKEIEDFVYKQYPRYQKNTGELVRD